MLFSQHRSRCAWPRSVLYALHNPFEWSDKITLENHQRQATRATHLIGTFMLSDDVQVAWTLREISVRSENHKGGHCRKSQEPPQHCLLLPDECSTVAAVSAGKLCKASRYHDL